MQFVLGCFFFWKTVIIPIVQCGNNALKIVQLRIQASLVPSRTNNCNCRLTSILQVCVCWHGVGKHIYLQLQCYGYFCPPPPVAGTVHAEPLTLQLLSCSTEYSRNHLVSPEPRSSLAAVVYRQCTVVVFDSALVAELPHVTQRVNVNRAQSASWLLLCICCSFGPWSDSG